jgi:hypothetical protein
MCNRAILGDVNVLPDADAVGESTSRHDDRPGADLDPTRERRRWMYDRCEPSSDTSGALRKSPPALGSTDSDDELSLARVPL